MDKVQQHTFIFIYNLHRSRMSFSHGNDMKFLITNSEKHDFNIVTRNWGKLKE